MTLVKPAVQQSAKTPTKPKVDETMAAVSAAGSLPLNSSHAETIEISSDSSSNYDEFSDREEGEDQNEEDSGRESSAAGSKNHVSGQTTPPSEAALARKPSQLAADTDADTEMQEDRPSASDDEATSPTFGDLIRGSSTVAVINVPATSLTSTSRRHHHHNPRGSTPLSLNATSSQHALAIKSSTTGAGGAVMAPARPSAPPPTLSSLGTVLNQALRTDDAVLLESCLHTTDLPTVRATIQRMDSALAGTLLTKLAARMHRRPARAHSLMAWVQWTLVAHGGALAAQPDLVRRLAELSRVLEERARALPSLLVLKGKLDMLDSQMQLRRDNLGAGGGRGRSGHGYEDGDDEDEDEDEDEEEGVVYVEGDEDKEGVDGTSTRSGMTNGVPRTRVTGDDELILANGIGGETDDDSEDDEGSMNGMDVDDDGDEAASQRSLDESEVDFDDVEESEDDTDGDAVGPPTKMQKVGRTTRR